jgi:hypothetical protein
MISGSHASVAETEASHELMLEVVVSRSEQGSLKSAGASIDGSVISGVTVIVLVVVATLPQASVAVQVIVVVPPPLQISMAVGV